MRALLDALALLVTSAGLAAFILAVVVRRSCWRTALGFTLDLWTAAGLLPLAGGPRWNRIVAVAAIILVRKLVGFGLQASASTSGNRTPGGGGGGGGPGRWAHVLRPPWSAGGAAWRRAGRRRRGRGPAARRFP